MLLDHPLQLARVFAGLLFFVCPARQDALAQDPNSLLDPTRFARLQPVDSGGAISTPEQIEAGSEVPGRQPWDGLPEGIESTGRWSFSFGVGVIAHTHLRDYFTLSYRHYNGPGSGRTYNISAAYRLHEFDWRPWNMRFRPQLELPIMLTLVEEDDDDLFPDYNLGLTFRWRDFPWNRYIYTTFALTGGLSYSSKVWTADRELHLNKDRSHLKYWLFIEGTVALPRFPRHQLSLFIDHQSGGWTLDKGGVDAWGMGYRLVF